MVGITELSKSVAKKTGVTQKVAQKVIKAFLDEIVAEVDKGRRVTLVGFGAFERRVQAPRVARNPRTGKVIKVPKKKKFTFRPSRKIKYKK